jgi:hypothetical protein
MHRRQHRAGQPNSVVSAEQPHVNLIFEALLPLPLTGVVPTFPYTFVLLYAVLAVGLLAVPDPPQVRFRGC